MAQGARPAGRVGRAPAQPAGSTVSILGHHRFTAMPARSTLSRWVKMALLQPAHIVLLLTDSRHARRLNREYRKRDYATNVLTFGYQRHPIAVADIVLCVPVARQESRQRGISLRAHLAHLVFHGVLHAQGFDHIRGKDALRMQRLEVALLARLKIADPYVL
jgi:probable rRNA maturation factor